MENNQSNELKKDLVNNDNSITPQLLENDTASDDNDEGFEGEDFPEKRFNSLAWLVQGNGRCGAAYFDGKTLFLTTNEFFPSKIFNKLASFLNKIACKAKVPSSLLSDESSVEIINNLSQVITKAIGEIADILETCYFKNEYFRDEVVYKKNVTRSLFKVAFSIITYFFQQHLQDFLSSPQAISQCNEVLNTHFIDLNTKLKLSASDANDLKRRFSNIQIWLQPYAEKGEERIFKKDLIDALLANNIKFLDAKPVLRLRDRQLHAEIKVLQHIYNKHKDDIKKDNLQSLQLQPYYIGIGKLCCTNCKCAVNAFNQVMSEKGLQMDFIQLRSTQGSDAKFPALVPDFLKDKTFAIKFLHLRYPDKDNIKNIYKMINRAFDEHSGRTVTEQEMRQYRSKAKSKSDNKSRSRRSKNTQLRRKEQSIADNSSTQPNTGLNIATLGTSMSVVTDHSKPSSPKNQEQNKTIFWRRKENQEDQTVSKQLDSNFK